ncbi:hypothetical protein AB0M95_33575 [Sphaerisporangium sp. NPDC051017]|uniref:hypothetical protein n=1 Tax=Sphaerisporangium sp. NPDC051017 TaxID=3154636 RepID=UPI0034451D7A
MDPALRFWLRYVEAEGGLAEPVTDGNLVLLPPALAQEFDLPAELTVTSDPEAAREDGLTFMATGHPALSRAADLVLTRGDAGIVALAPPASVPPSADVLLAKARDQFPVDHGRIDPAGSTVATVRPMLRAGVLITYALSSEDHFQERAECWLDIRSRLPLPGEWMPKLLRLPPAQPRADLPSGVEEALTETHRMIEAAALIRRDALAGQFRTAYEQERQRARDYYDDQITSIENRLRGADAERAALLAARLTATREERTRRLDEIAEKYQAHHEIRPFQLHVVQVPAIRLPVHVLRGSRRYPLVLDYLTPVGMFAALRCPSCGTPEPLVAGKTKLGCESCLAKPSDPVTPPPRIEPVAAKPAVSISAQAATTTPAIRAAGKQQVLPPKAKSQATPKAGEKLAREFWTSVVRGNPALGGLLMPDSPAATLFRLYGVNGPETLFGMGARPTGHTAKACRPHPEQPEAVSGQVREGDYLYGYQITWRLDGSTALAEELLPNVNEPGHRLHPHWMLMQGLGRATRNLPAPRGLDQVERLIWKHSMPYHGLPLVLRMLTAWQRISDQDAVFHTHQPKAVAAAIDRMVIYRAGDRGHYNEVAELYRVAEDAVRAADKTLARRLQLSSTRLW